MQAAAKLCMLQLCSFTLDQQRRTWVVECKLSLNSAWSEALGSYYLRVHKILPDRQRRTAVVELQLSLNLNSAWSEALRFYYVIYKYIHFCPGGSPEPARKDRRPIYKRRASLCKWSAQQLNT